MHSYQISRCAALIYLFLYFPIFSCCHCFCDTPPILYFSFSYSSLFTFLYSQELSMLYETLVLLYPLLLQGIIFQYHFNLLLIEVKRLWHKLLIRSCELTRGNTCLLLLWGPSLTSDGSPIPDPLPNPFWLCICVYTVHHMEFMRLYWIGPEVLRQIFLIEKYAL